MATSNLELEFQYDDNETTYKVSVGPFASTSTAITAAKTNIKAFNTAWKSDYNEFAEYFGTDSLNFASDNVITAATVVTQEVTNYNLSEEILKEAAENGESNS